METKCLKEKIDQTIAAFGLMKTEKSETRLRRRENMNNIEVVREKIEKLDDQINRICNRRTKLEKQESELNCEKILTEKLLSKGKWTLQTWGIDGCFQLAGRGDDYPEIVEALDPQKNGYHFRTRLTDKVSLAFCDGDLSIDFDDYSFEVAVNFIQDHNITVDIKSVTKLLNEIQERFVTIKKIHDQFKS